MVHAHACERGQHDDEQARAASAYSLPVRLHAHEPDGLREVQDGRRKVLPPRGGEARDAAARAVAVQDLLLGGHGLAPAVGLQQRVPIIVIVIVIAIQVVSVSLWPLAHVC